MSFGKKFMDYLDVRFGFRDLLHHNFTEYLLPRNITAWYALGAVLLVLFAVQFITGILLLVYYIPDTERAFASVQAIMNKAPFGWLIRYLHAIGSSVIVLGLLLHMLSTLFISAYKAPREITWVFGFLLFLTALGMNFTGYLLPWSQLSYWATVIGTNTPQAVPVIGDKIVLFLRGGPSVGQQTLSRFFALHVMGLPLIFGILISVHLFLVRRIGVSVPPFGPAYRPEPPPTQFRHPDYPGGIPFFPNYVMNDLAVIYLFLTLLVGMVFFAPWVLLPDQAFEPADPFTTPAGIKPEWYFLIPYQILRIFPNKRAGIMVQIVLLLFLFILPFIDRSMERRPAHRPVFVSIFMAGILVFIGLTVWGFFS